MSLIDVLALVKKTFKPRRNVDFEDMDLHMELEPLTSTEEVKVLESIKDANGAEYMEGLKRNTLAFAIKKINEVDLDADTITSEVDGKKVTKSKFLYMQDYLGQWPFSVIENLFEVFTNLLVETEDIIKKKMKHEVYVLSEPVQVEEPPKPGELRKVVEPDEPTDENDALRRQVEKEGLAAEAAVAAEQERLEAAAQ